MPFKPKDPNINRNGRPKKDRALTAILERAGSKTVEMDGKSVSGRRLMALQVWEGITTGEVSFPNGKKLQLSPQDWKDFVKWAYAHIDGPPKSEVDITTAGQAITFLVERDDNEQDQAASEAT